MAPLPNIWPCASTQFADAGSGRDSHTVSRMCSCPGWTSALNPMRPINHGITASAAGSTPYHEQWSARPRGHFRSEEHTSELQSLMRISYAAFCLTKKNYRPLMQNSAYKKKKQ